jgi:EAL domain-containing protein (putative c-di-GMP-specific phosphodiesterase class I)
MRARHAQPDDYQGAEGAEAARTGARLPPGSVAEGVETQAQGERLRELNYDLNQGCLNGAPMSADQSG